MDTKSSIFSVIALVLLLLPVAPLMGATFLPISDEVASLRSEAEGDVYAMSNSVVIAAPVQGDIFAAGDTVDISGSATSSVFAIGRLLTISGEVRDDVRVAGSIVSIASIIANDLFVLGSEVRMVKTAHVQGDAYIAGDSSVISGTIDGSLRVTGSNIVITSDAVINGDVIAYGDTPTIDDGATIGGETKVVLSNETQSAAQFTLRGFIGSIVSASLLALLLIFAAPKLVAGSKEFIVKHPVQSGLIGLTWVLLFIPIVLLLIISNIGLSIGMLLLFGTFPLIFISFGCMVISIGSITNKLFTKGEGVLWHHAIIGALLVSVLTLLGVVGFTLLLFALLVSFGAVLKTFRALI